MLRLLGCCQDSLRRYLLETKCLFVCSNLQDDDWWWLMVMTMNMKMNDEFWMMYGGWWHQHPKTRPHLIFGWIQGPQVPTSAPEDPRDSTWNAKHFHGWKTWGMELKMFSLLRSSWFFRNPTTQNMKFKKDHGVQKVSKIYFNHWT